MNTKCCGKCQFFKLYSELNAYRDEKTCNCQKEVGICRSREGWDNALKVAPIAIEFKHKDITKSDGENCPAFMEKRTRFSQ